MLGFGKKKKEKKKLPFGFQGNLQGTEGGCSGVRYSKRFVYFSRGTKEKGGKGRGEKGKGKEEEEGLRALSTGLQYKVR